MIYFHCLISLVDSRCFSNGFYFTCDSITSSKEVNSKIHQFKNETRISFEAVTPFILNSDLLIDDSNLDYIQFKNLMGIDVYNKFKISSFEE